MIRLVVLVMIIVMMSASMGIQAKGTRLSEFVPIIEATVKKRGGIPTLHINGQPKPFIAWAQYDTYPNLVETAVRAGIRIYQPRLIAGFQTAQFIENQMHEVLAKDPNAYFLPSVWVGGDQVYGFDKRDTSDYNTDTAASWNAVSFGSQEWVNRVELQLRDNIRKLETGKLANHILGYMILAGNTGEWFYVDTYTDRDFDRSLANKATFREWLKNRYHNNVSKLTASWHQPNINFDTAEIPSKVSGDPFLDPQKNRNVVDYVQYHNERIADVTSRLASVIKQEARRKKLVAIYSGYNMELGAFGPIGGQLCMEKMLESPDIDLIWSPFDYTNRVLSGFTGSHGTMDSIRIAGKLHVGEDDYATHIGSDHWGAKPLADDIDGSIALMWRNFGYTLTKSFGQWWYDDSGYGSYNNAKLVNNMKAMTQIADASVSLSRRSTTEVALVVDEYSQMVQSPTASASPVNAQMIVLRSTLSHMGAPYDVILLSDVLKGKAKQYKLLIMANAFAWDLSARKLWSQMDKRGQTVMWLYSPGYWTRTTDGSDTKSTQGIDDLTGLPIKQGINRSYTISAVSSDAASMTGVHDGDQLVNVQEKIPFFYIAVERGLTVLGRTDSKATCVLQKLDGWNQVWFGAPMVSSWQFYQSIARMAGVHIYSPKGRVVNANASFVFITIPEASEEQVVFTGRHSIFDVSNNKQLVPNKDGSLTVKTSKPVTLAYFLGPKSKLPLLNEQPLSTTLARLVIRTSGESLQQQRLNNNQPRAFTLDAGSGKQLDVTGVTSDNYYFYRDEMNANLSWASSRPEVASIDSQGYVRAHQPGTTMITALVDGVAATASVQVYERPKQSLINRVTDPNATWSTWSVNHGLHTFSLGNQNEYGVARVMESVLGEDGSTRSGVIRFQPLANGEQVGVTVESVRIPDKRGVKLIARLYFPEQTDPKTAATLYVLGYDEKLTQVLSQQVEVKPTGNGTDIEADLSAYAGKTMRLDFLVRHKEGTPVEPCKVDLAEAYLTWDEADAPRSLAGTSFTEMNKNTTTGGVAQLSVVNHYSDGSSEAYTPVSGSVWESSRPDIVAIHPDGSITALKPGNVKITLLTPKTETSVPLMMECFIHVVEKGDAATGVKPMGLIADKPYVLLNPGKTHRISINEITNRGYLRNPSGVVSYSVNQGDAVSISSNGVVKAIHPGVAIVQVEMNSLRTQYLVEVRKPGQAPTSEAPFKWTIFERMPAYDYSKILAYRYSGLQLGK